MSAPKLTAAQAQALREIAAGRIPEERAFDSLPEELARIELDTPNRFYLTDAGRAALAAHEESK